MKNSKNSQEEDNQESKSNSTILSVGSSESGVERDAPKKEVNQNRLKSGTERSSDPSSIESKRTRKEKAKDKMMDEEEPVDRSRSRSRSRSRKRGGRSRRRRRKM